MKMAGKTLQDAGTLVHDAGMSIADGGAGVLSDAGELLADAGTMLQDAGHAMRDPHTARDAGRNMMHTGQHMMDAGHALMDAADDADAVVHAQSCGQWCSPEGAQRMITADQDSTRYVWRQYMDADWHKESMDAGAGTAYWAYTIEVRTGPFMLQRLTTIGGNGTALYLTSSSNSCSRGIAGNNVDLPAPRTAVTAPGDLPLMIQAGEHLCAYTSAYVTSGQPLLVAVTIDMRGYQPYE